MIPAYDIPETEMICHLVGSKSPWYGEFYTYLCNHTLPPNQSNNQRKAFIHQTTRYTIIAETLYRHSLDGTLLQCLEKDEITKALEEVHEGICGTHASGPSLAKKLMRTGYYWPSMEKDSYYFVRKCKKYQVHGDLIHALAQEF